mmetsp:Transcript_5002/g.18717  ORF Transcript_5002/g.18717 Transcript_5002/m.18717 type:complete len:433 (+) Transcript_5002:415-1713(+)
MASPTEARSCSSSTIELRCSMPTSRRLRLQNYAWKVVITSQVLADQQHLLPRLLPLMLLFVLVLGGTARRGRQARLPSPAILLRAARVHVALHGGGHQAHPAQGPKCPLALAALTLPAARGAAGRIVAAIVAARLVGGGLAGAAAAVRTLRMSVLRRGGRRRRGFVAARTVARGLVRRQNAMQVRLHRKPASTKKRLRWRPMQWIAARPHTGPSRKLGPVPLGGNHSEAVLSTMVSMRDKPREGQIGRAQRALWQIDPVDADLVEVVLTRCRYNCLHQQRLRTERAIRHAINCQRVTGGGELHPLQLLRCRHHLPLVQRPILRQGLEEVTGHTRTAARGLLAVALASARSFPIRICQQGLHELAHNIPHVLRLSVVVLVRGHDALLDALRLLWEVGVQEACQQAVRARHHHTLTVAEAHAALDAALYATDPT